MSLPTFRRFHAYAPGREPPFTAYPWPALCYDGWNGIPRWSTDNVYPRGPAWGSCVLAQDDGVDYLYHLDSVWLRKFQYADTDPDDHNRPGRYIAKVQIPRESPVASWPNYPSLDTDGVDLYVGRRLRNPGWQRESVYWDRRRTSDLSVLQTWDCSCIIGARTFTPAGYPITGTRLDYFWNARLAPAPGHLYCTRIYWTWPQTDANGQWLPPYPTCGWDILDVDLEAASYRVMIDMPPPGAGYPNPAYGLGTIFALRRLPLVAADEGQSIWVCQTYYYLRADGLYDSKEGIWRSEDGGENWSGPVRVGGWDVDAGAATGNIAYEAGLSDGAPMLLNLRSRYDGVTFINGWRLKAWDLRDAADPLMPYQERDADADEDMHYAVAVFHGSSQPVLSYHAAAADQRLVCIGADTWFLNINTKWRWTADADPLRGEFEAWWLFRAYISRNDLNVIHDAADLVHIHVCAEDGLRQYRDHIAAVADAEPTIIGDYGVPGCTRQPTGFLRLLAADDGAMQHLTSDDDGAAWLSAGAIGALAGCRRPTIHPLGHTVTLSAAKGLPLLYLLSAWKDDAILIYRALDGVTWSEISILAEGVPEQKIDAIIYPTGRIRAYYATADAVIYSRMSDDEGATWGDPAVVLSGFTHPAALALPHGEVLLSCWQGDQLVLARSTDGESFGDALNVRDAGGSQVPDHGEPHKTALARDAAGRIYLFFVDSDDLKVTTSDDSGYTWS